MSYQAIASSYLTVIVVLPVATALFPVAAAQSRVALTCAIAIAPISYVFAYLTVCIALSVPHQRSIKAGKFVRDVADTTYRGRRLYGLCWSAIYFNTPIYWFYLSVPLLRALLFRGFGYRGSLDFTIYPDTWIRDLPLLQIGSGAYIANKSTLGTNMPTQDGGILVDRISIGSNAMIGHLTMIAAGAVVGRATEIGHGVAIGANVVVGEGAIIGGCTTIYHKASVGDSVVIGPSSYIGPGARIGSKVEIREYSFIPSRAVITNQDDLQRYVNTPQHPLSSLRSAVNHVT